MPRLEGGLHGLKADSSARADDQDGRHGVMLPVGSAWLNRHVRCSQAHRREPPTSPRPSPDLIARLSNHSTAPSGAAFRRTTTKITIHAMATSKRQPPTNMATRPGFSLTISPGRVGKISEVVAKLFHLCENHITIEPVGQELLQTRER